MKPGYAYMLTSKPDGVLCIGMTDDLSKRVEQHRGRAVPGFTRSYDCDRLVGFEVFEKPHDARLFEHRMKKTNRAWKIARIVERNPERRDLVDRLHG